MGFYSERTCDVLIGNDSGVFGNLAVFGQKLQQLSANWSVRYTLRARTKNSTAFSTARRTTEIVKKEVHHERGGEKEDCHCSNAGRSSSEDKVSTPDYVSTPPSLQCNSLTDSVGSHRRTIGSNRVSRMDAGRLPAAREFRRDAERQEPLQVLRE
jgi:hypothetical protein